MDWNFSFQPPLRRLMLFYTLTNAKYKAIKDQKRNERRRLFTRQLENPDSKRPPPERCRAQA
jgi:hypothetical protein